MRRHFPIEPLALSLVANPVAWFAVSLPTLTAGAWCARRRWLG